MSHTLDNNSNIYDVIIIGAGASGLFAASAFATTVKGLVINNASQPGLKLLMAGSGQCNITHGGDIKDFIGHYGKNGPRIRTPLYRYNNLALMDFFENSGVPLITRTDGKVFPKSLNAKDILNALVTKASLNGFKIRTHASVTSIEALGDNFRITAAVSANSVHNEAVFVCKKLIVATGGCSYPTTGSNGSMFKILDEMGIKIEALAPALVPVSVQDYPYKDLSGISFSNIELNLSSQKEKPQKFTGDLLFTHNNFSGPVILNSSRYITVGTNISINYFPGKTADLVSKELKKQFGGNPKEVLTALTDYCKSHKNQLPKRFLELILERTVKSARESGADIMSTAEKASNITAAQTEIIAKFLTGDSFSVSGLGSYNNAMVTAGGVSLDEINIKTMESKKYPHLHIIGEALDVDGDTGGYNLQFAFSSGHAAALEG